jgi:hypothetical protein
MKSFRNILTELPNIINNIRNTNKIIEPKIDITYSIQISFYTNGQIRYLDENERPKIIEFNGNSWSINFLQYKKNKTSLSTFLNNTSLKKDQVVTLTMQINGEIISQKSFNILGENAYEGWFKLY